MLVVVENGLYGSVQTRRGPFILSHCRCRFAHCFAGQPFQVENIVLLHAVQFALAQINRIGFGSGQQVEGFRRIIGLQRLFGQFDVADQVLTNNFPFAPFPRVKLPGGQQLPGRLVVAQLVVQGDAFQV